ncbi:DNA-binding XRE family transcriptional regulator [Thermosporothrix hazakensis]|uniref:DNA-binding XRE family transcriptional regulator n=2 Tax=Thermosporothrix TaxID=768650 RepID=A0A326U909_THEHA|nr:DNA-binding XRE family transcriptional regulator [Thermosporothrix hazakensis]
MYKSKPYVKLREERERLDWTQSYVAAQIGTTKETVSRWETGRQPISSRFQLKLCSLFGKSAKELGFLDNDQELTSMDMLRRKLLKSFGVMATAPASVGGDDPLTLLENSMPALWQLGYSGSLDLIALVLAFALPSLDSLVQDKHSAAIASQTYQLDWMYANQMLNFGRALKSSQKAYEYAKLSGDHNLMAVSLIRKAHTYYHLKQPARQLSVQEEVLPMLKNTTPLVQSWLYFTMAEAQASLNQEYEAKQAFELAEKKLPLSLKDQATSAYALFSREWILKYQLMIFLRLKEAKPALEMIEKHRLEKGASDLIWCEYLNRRCETMLLLGDMDEMALTFERALQFAEKTQSELRLNEISETYTQAAKKWPKETRLKQLRMLLHRRTQYDD